MSSRSETSLKDTKYVPECLKWMLIAAAILIAIGKSGSLSSKVTDAGKVCHCSP